MHAFDAVLLPRWLYDFLNPLMETIQRLFAEAHERDLTGAEIGASVSEALLLKRSGSGVRGDAFTNRRLDERDHSLARDVWIAKQRQPSAWNAAACPAALRCS